MAGRGRKSGWQSVTLTDEAKEALKTIEVRTAALFFGASVNVSALISALLVKEAERMSQETEG